MAHLWSISSFFPPSVSLQLTIYQSQHPHSKEEAVLDEVAVQLTGQYSQKLCDFSRGLSGNHDASSGASQVLVRLDSIISPFVGALFHLKPNLVPPKPISCFNGYEDALVLHLQVIKGSKYCESFPLSHNRNQEWHHVIISQGRVEKGCFYFMCMAACMYEHVPYPCLVPPETRRDH